MKLLLAGAAAAVAVLAFAAPDTAACGDYGRYAYGGGYHPGYGPPQHFRPHLGYADPWSYGRARVIVAPAYYPRMIVHPHHARWHDPRWSGHTWAPRHHRFPCQAIGCTRWSEGRYGHPYDRHSGYGGASVSVRTGW